MNGSIRMLNRTMLLACGPFIGLMAWLLLSQFTVTLSGDAWPAAPAAEGSRAGAAESPAAKLEKGLEQAQQTAAHTGRSIQKQLKLYKQTNEEMANISAAASSLAKRPLAIYDRRITRKLGTPSATIESDKLRAQLFYIKAQNFRAYALKVRLKSDDAMKMALGRDELGGAETTLSAVKRYKAAAGVNAGGFADGGGKRYPLGTTVLNGQYVDGFQPSYKDLFFVGLNGNNKLIGGKFYSKQQLDALKPKFGASFVPMLLKNGARLPIPEKWQNNPRRAPRTVIANYKDDQLLFLVVDGYSEDGSSGATLDEVQTLLQRYGAVDGYNLDGGGSSTLVFNGRVVNHPSDGQLRKVATNFLFFK
jgi:exopolysaccharide biosynthesis protein